MNRYSCDFTGCKQWIMLQSNADLARVGWTFRPAPIGDGIVIRCVSHPFHLDAANDVPTEALRPVSAALKAQFLELHPNERALIDHSFSSIEPAQIMPLPFPYFSREWTHEDRLRAVQLCANVMARDIPAGNYSATGRPNCTSIAEGFCGATADELERGGTHEYLLKWWLELEPGCTTYLDRNGEVQPFARIGAGGRMYAPREPVAETRTASNESDIVAAFRPVFATIVVEARALLHKHLPGESELTSLFEGMIADAGESVGMPLFVQLVTSRVALPAVPKAPPDLAMIARQAVDVLLAWLARFRTQHEAMIHEALTSAERLLAALAAFPAVRDDLRAVLTTDKPS